jgi:hypothetical protein
MQVGPHLSPTVWNTIMEAHGYNPVDANASNQLREKICGIFREALVSNTNLLLTEKKLNKKLKLQNKYKNKISVEQQND